VGGFSTIKLKRTTTKEGEKIGGRGTSSEKRGVTSSASVVKPPSYR